MKSRKRGKVPPDAFVKCAVLLAAPFIGSFLGTLALRLPKGEPVLGGRSACPACGHVLGPLELIPLASWAILRGRCRSCGAAISAFYPAIALAALAGGGGGNTPRRGFLSRLPHRMGLAGAGGDGGPPAAQAMMSGSRASSRRAIWSLSCSLRFFRRVICG